MYGRGQRVRKVQTRILRVHRQDRLVLEVMVGWEYRQQSGVNWNDNIVREFGTKLWILLSFVIQFLRYAVIWVRSRRRLDGSPESPARRGLHEKHEMQIWILLRAERLLRDWGELWRNCIVLTGGRSFGWPTGLQRAGGPSSARSFAARPECTVVLGCVKFGVRTLRRVSYWLTEWLTEWLTYWLIDLLTYWLTELLTDWFTDWLTDWLTDLLTDWLT